MERTRIPRKRAHRSRFALNCHFSPKQYPCRDTLTGALHPVAPGQSRAGLYCASCTVSRCLLDRDRPTRSRRPGRTDNNRAFMDACRRAGISSKGRPLARRCWNCANLRRVVHPTLEIYVCHWRYRDRTLAEIVAAARGRKTMLGRQPAVPEHGCGGVAFEMRRGAIEVWDPCGR